MSPRTPDESFARARSSQDGALEIAHEVLLRCLLGQVDPRTGEIQRKAALDVLAGATLRAVTDADLLAEVERREKKRAG